MSDPRLLVPASVEGRGHRHTRFGIAAGSRFFVGLAAGLMWLVAALFEPRLIYVLAGWNLLILVAWLVDVWRLPAPGSLVVRRSWSAPPALSVESRVRLTLRNESAIALRARVVDTVPSQLRNAPPAMALGVEPGGEAEAEYNISPAERGKIALGDAYIRYQSRFGIAERWARATLAQTIVLYPNLEEAKRHSVFLVRSRQIEMERRSRRIRSAGRSFESLREYQEGDESRDICWTASARRGKLVTRLYETERSQAIWIVIDAGRLMRARVGDTSKLDRAVNGALTLSRVALGSGDRVGILAYGRKIDHYLPASRGTAHLREIMEHLALVRAAESEADHVQAAARLLSDQKRRSLVVWITDVPDTAMTPEVVRAASQLMPRHLVLFVVSGQPDLAGVARRRPRNPDEMYHTAAAQEVLHRRDVLLAGLRARGALALEVGLTLSPALVNTYLDVKQRSRL